MTVDEIIGHFEGRAASDEVTLLRSAPSQRTSRTTWPRVGAAAAAIALVVGLVAALLFIGHGDPGPASAPSTPPIVTPAPTVVLGQFVWPAPPRGYATLHELIAAFTTEVLDWTTFDVDGSITNESRPHSFNLINHPLDASVAAINKLPWRHSRRPQRGISQRSSTPR